MLQQQWKDFRAVIHIGTVGLVDVVGVGLFWSLGVVKYLLVRSRHSLSYSSTTTVQIKEIATLKGEKRQFGKWFLIFLNYLYLGAKS